MSSEVHRFDELENAKLRADLREAKLDNRRAEKETQKVKRQIQEVVREMDARIQILLAPPKD